ncbi:YraN family protein [Cellulophaga baltica]|uniref:YraN family protein n=1 Tax=Cellulophaga TaxID=104264 RepID=UPI001C078D8E|nr:MULTISPECIES: YraN family protein [Cellulophaga]MBU2997768.1 YraN family protein [Cellulophaga baltica]MDO6769164.1 YraN family protein [Cellulophaga sp. 1_MG-2023]
MAEHNDFGKLGEQYAVEFLQKNGYDISYRNYRYLKAEVDIIAQKENVLAIIEVKARSTNFIDNVADLIPQKKIKLLVAAADHYVTSNNLDVEIRFDVILVYKKNNNFKVEHIEDAFYHF